MKNRWKTTPESRTPEPMQLDHRGSCDYSYTIRPDDTHFSRSTALQHKLASVEQFSQGHKTTSDLASLGSSIEAQEAGNPRSGSSEMQSMSPSPAPISGIAREPKRRRTRKPKQLGGYPCNGCDKIFDREGDMRKHRNSVHSSYEAKAHGCIYCNSRFVEAKDLRRHVTSIHTT